MNRVIAPAQSARDNSRVGVALVAVALSLVAAAVLALWSFVVPRAPHPIEVYAPMPNGASFTYRIINADGSVMYRSRNLHRLPPASDATFVEMRDVEYDAKGEKSLQSFGFLSITDDEIKLFGIGDLSGAIPIISLNDATKTFTGTYQTTTPYLGTFQMLGRGALDTPLGHLADCLQTRQFLDMDLFAYESQTWFCRGIGETVDESTDWNKPGTTKRAELVAMSIGDVVRGSAPVIPNSDMRGGLQYVFAEPLMGTVREQMTYKESSASGVGTDIVPIGELLLYGTTGGALVGLDRTTQQERWRFYTGGAVYSTPVIDNGIAYFGSADKKVYAVRVSDGAFVWAFQTRDAVSDTPAVAFNTVYVPSEDRNLYALDADTGIERWRFRASSPLNAQPILYEDILYVGAANGVLYALNARTGSLLWKFEAEGALTAPVTVGQDVLYVGSYAGNLYALALKDGSELWNRALEAPIEATMVLAEERLYFATDQEVYALNGTDGTILWRYKSIDTFRGAPLVMGNQIWIARATDVVALDRATGQLLKQLPAGVSNTVSGVSSNGKELYVGRYEGTLNVYGGDAP